MKRLIAAVAASAALVGVGAASAHPLGNFTVNRQSGIELSGDSIYVRYALDLAEIPTFQEGEEVRAPSFAQRVAEGLELEVDGRRVALAPLEYKVQERPGAGGLATLRFDGVFAAPRDGSGRTLVFRDTNFSSRIGWKEVVVRADRGARIVSSTAPRESVSDELRAYPDDLLQSPPDVSSARVVYEPGAAPGAAPRLGGPAAEARAAGGFESLIARDDLSAGVILLSLLAAAFWGAAHALTPGHGKAIVAGYLVGSRGKPRHAVALGLIVTATHTVGVFALGLVTLLLSRFVVPETLYPWLTLASGLLVVAVGASVLTGRVRRTHAHAHGPGDHHHHHHGHGHDRGYGRGGLLGVGVAAGILPCPSALVVLLSAIALHRVGLGLVLILAFSVGLAATVTAVGLVAVLARRAFGRLSLNGRFVRALPAVSALVILALGVGITVNALPEVL
jgi:nickel/cobalt transporter (NicO) family protein